jgi:hypothetical protein
MRGGLVLVLAVIAPACGPSTDAPTPVELYGTWVNHSDGVERAFVFVESADAPVEVAGMTPVYLLYRYPVGLEPVMTQAGTYDVARRDLDEPGGIVTDDALITTVAWDETDTLRGQTFANGIETWDDDVLTLRNTNVGTLRFERAPALP